MMPVTFVRSTGFLKASRMERASGWVLELSADAAQKRVWSAVKPSAGRISVTRKVPVVRVPVLSKTTVPVRARVSR
jgi:hypothetical protein